MSRNSCSILSSFSRISEIARTSSISEFVGEGMGFSLGGGFWLSMVGGSGCSSGIGALELTEVVSVFSWDGLAAANSCSESVEIDVISDFFGHVLR